MTMVGRVLAQYQISEKLGEGGMGIVWKARDTHLDRFVALKTLPAERLSDPERKRRFVQEAKAASALNHPNIVHIYDVAETDGTQYISMEYVPGKTLDQLIGRKGLRLGEALKYALQIADALAQAHSAGIVHRDLKPSNIIVTQNGLVKVLDFGLAKLTEVAADQSEETALITERDAPKTEEGAIVGTVAYMSPEQAEGKKVDARSDIFSFGSLLYEMVTGNEPFRRDSKLSTLSAILRDEPKPVSAVMSDAPRDLEKIIARCLRKDPARRFQHMADVKVALQELKEESESGQLTNIVQPPTPNRRILRWTWIVTGAAILLVLVAATGFWFLRPKSHPTPTTIPLTSYPGSQINPAFSPDGKQVAFAWEGEKGDNFDIYVKLVDAGAPLRLTSNPAKEFSPAWSPDGRYIAFCRELPDHSEIWVIPALGGAERRLGTSAECDAGSAWTPDGRSLVISDNSAPGSPLGLYVMSAETGDKRRITSPPKGYAGDIGPLFSPDGKTLAFSRAHSYLKVALYLLALGDRDEPRGEPRLLTPDQPFIMGADWTSDGRSIVFSSGQMGSSNLWIVPASGGTPERLVGGENAEDLSVSRTSNRLIYTHLMFDLNVWRIPGPRGAHKNSPPTPFLASTKLDQEPQFSPDGKKIAFVSTRSGNNALWLCDNDGLNLVQLAADDTARAPGWSPDSRSIAFATAKSGNYDICVISADGGPVRCLNTGPSDNLFPSWSRDGRWIYFGSNRSGDWQIWKAPARGGTAVQVTRKGGSVALESLNGEFVYYAKEGSPGIWKVPVGGGDEIQVLDQGEHMAWALADEGIYVRVNDSSFAPNGVVSQTQLAPAIKFYSFATRHLSVVREFSKDTKMIFGFSVSPDKHWITYTQVDQAGSDLMLLENYR